MTEEIVEVTTKVLSNPLRHPIQYYRAVQNAPRFLKIIHTDDVNPDNILYPENLKHFTFIYESNIRNPEKLIIFPEGAESIILMTNYPLERFDFPEGLERLIVSLLGPTNSQDPADLVFPNSLHYLSIIGNLDPSYDFSDMDFNNIKFIALPEEYERITYSQFPKNVEVRYFGEINRYHGRDHDSGYESDHNQHVNGQQQQQQDDDIDEEIQEIFIDFVLYAIYLTTNILLQRLG